MGITIHYRGRIDDLDRIEDFEDRVFDLALELGGSCRIWRTSADHDPQRLVRGVILNLFPGQESTSLLISPEGWLIGLMQIEEAERGDLAEPPWCFVKTQFGPVEGHVALIELLTSLQREFITNLEVSDEGGYWESRDVSELARKFAFLKAAIDGLADGLRRHGLSREAAEDPEILIHRIARVAEQVRRTLSRASEHPPLQFRDDTGEFGPPPDAAEVEAEWDAFHKDRSRTQERFHRSVEERLARGEDHDEAFEGALRDAGLADADDDGSDADDWDEDRESDEFAALEDQDDNEIEEDAFPKDRHPLLHRTMQYRRQLHDVFDDVDPEHSNAVSVLFQGFGEVCGGLAQALSRHGLGDIEFGLTVVQLKRALRGSAFARGALYQIRGPNAPPKAVITNLLETLDQFEKEIFQELSQVRAEREKEDG